MEKEKDNESWVHESVEDNEGIANDSISGSRVQSNGSCAVENSDRNELNLEGAEGSGHGELKPKETTPTRKGAGLKKWRRIRRDANRDGDNNNNNMEAHEAPHSGAKPSKRVQYADTKQKSEGSVSSTNAVVRNFDGFPPLDDYNLGLSPAFAAGTDSENSEDRSSKSSTAASAPKIKYEIPGFPRDRSKMSSSNGKNSTHSGGQFGHHGKGRAETGKKARGERVKIEKENSHSSVESDSRSSNFVFVQGSFFIDNGIRNEVTNEYDGENGDEAQNQVNHGHQDGYGKDGEGGFEDLSTEDGVADSSWAGKGKEERSENHGSMRENDPLAESMRALLSVQEALQEEVNKFKEIGNDVSVDGPISDLCNEYVDVEQKLQETSGEGSSSHVVEAEAELEGIFKQKIEAEVEYLAISRTLQNLRVAAVDQMSVLEQTKVLDKVGDNENKAAALGKKAEKLEIFCEEIANSNKIMKLQKEAFKYGSCFLMQLVLLFVVCSFFIHQFSQDYVEVVPT